MNSLPCSQHQNAAEPCAVMTAIRNGMRVHQRRGAIKTLQKVGLSLPWLREWVPHASAFSPAGLCLAVPDKTVRWCAVSEHENSKCISFRDHMKGVLPADGPQLACVKKTSYSDCIKAISVSRAASHGRRLQGCFL